MNPSTSKILFLTPIVLLLLSGCYPFAIYQAATVLDPGEEQVGAGVGIISNVLNPDEDSLATETSFISDLSLSARRGVTERMEMGVKFVDLPWRKGTILVDTKILLLKKPLPLAVDMGFSYWFRGGNSYNYLGYHPAIIVGEGKLFAVARYNYLAHPSIQYETVDLLLGSQIHLEDGQMVMTPMLGIHRGSIAPENIHVSLGLGFQVGLEL